jgi:hypothetical protein
VRYLSTTTQAITPSQNTVSWNTLDANTQQDLGINNKNRIINGNMAIDQRNNGASITFASSVERKYTVDRWGFVYFQNSKFTGQQNLNSITPPAGFANYFGLQTAATFTVGTTEVFTLSQLIEGYNVADLNWGSANAKTVTLSFWVQSSLTGTFGGAIGNSNGTRGYPFSYTISSANTWEYKTVTVTGDTSGTWLNTNGSGIRIDFSLATGATYSGTAGAWVGAERYSVTGAVTFGSATNQTFYLTGVQFEVGTQATTFTTAGGSYGAELALCQRYYEVQTAGSDGLTVISAVYAGSTNNRVWQTFAVLKRATPTISLASGAVWAGALGAGGPTINPSISGVSYSGSDYFVAYNPSAKTVQANAEL